MSGSVPELDDGAAAAFARLALDCLDREYPSHILHLLSGAADVRPPRELTPAFFGCFDWHSAVHGHWLLARLLRFFPGADWVREAREKLGRHLTADNVAGEVAYLSAPGREGFERPYGLAWLLQLGAELRESQQSDAQRWSRALEPLEQLAVVHLSNWLPRLTYPIRSGEHSQTAFSMGLGLDWSRTAGERAFERLLVERTFAFYRGDRNASLAFEPSGHDFLSPALAEADLMRRVLSADEFAGWLDGFLPDIARSDRDQRVPSNVPSSESPQEAVPSASPSSWLAPVTPADRRDGKLAHLDGLNLSRAWMLVGIAAGLPSADPRIPLLMDAARQHRAAGLPAVTGEHYAGGHWLGTFAVYLTTRRGVAC